MSLDLEFVVAIHPFTKLNECGDFAIHVKATDHSYLMIGDLGGHGHPILGQAVQVLEALFRQHCHLPLTELFEKIRQDAFVQDFGIALLIADYQIKTKKLDFIAMGNLQIHHWQHNWHKVWTQKGVLSLYLPGTAQVHSLGLAKGDTLMVLTDGVDVNKCLLDFDWPLSATALQHSAQQLVEQYGTHTDDEMCVLIKVVELGAVNNADLNG